MMFRCWFFALLIICKSKRYLVENLRWLLISFTMRQNQKYALKFEYLLNTSRQLVFKVKGFFFLLLFVYYAVREWKTRKEWQFHTICILNRTVKFRFSKKAQKFWNNLPLVWLCKCQIKWEIVSIFCGLFIMSEF